MSSEEQERRARELFDRYERTFARALEGQADMEEVASLYAAEFIAASPHGVRAGKNDVGLREMMSQGNAYYRQIGTKSMRVREVNISSIDEHHCVANVGWTATYDRGEGPDVSIDFEVHYLVQVLGAGPKVFGWVSGDEQAVLREHGIV